eukprot:5415653-Prymnesium_polylepis.1
MVAPLAPPLAPPAAPPSSPDSTSAAQYAVGMAFAVVSGLLVAYAMVVQRYALSFQSDEGPPGQPALIPFWGRKIRPLFVWVIGLFIYGIGSGATYSVAGLLIPLSLLSALFVTLLVFNLPISKAVLGETPTLAKKAGAGVVLLGCAICAVGAPTDSKTEFTSDEVADLFSNTVGAAWFIGLGVTVVSSVIAICVFEQRYPTGDLLAAAQSAGATTNPRLAPRWLEMVMSFVYPASLGLDEAIVHICLRAGNGMSSTCANGGCEHGIYPLTLSMWLCTGMATLWWLRVVFRRYETTVALPVEYGAMTAADV